MPGYLLDTNVISELRRARPHKGVVNWISSMAPAEIFVSAVSFGEIQRGVEATRRANAAKAREIETWLDAVVGSFPVVAVDRDMFRECARLLHRKSRSDFEDAMIAATARVCGLTVATRNVRDFQAFGVPVFDPFGFKD
ncbi:MAG: type II toxin-antitoxin system VapC family toxin [Alphaproteobacteria bacterium]|nr:type II toxin-antitoxin system VapC family toxin [Alphaproteobacteria bacterium]